MQINIKQHVTLNCKAKGHLVSNNRVSFTCVILLVVLNFLHFVIQLVFQKNNVNPPNLLS